MSDRPENCSGSDKERRWLIERWLEVAKKSGVDLDVESRTVQRRLRRGLSSAAGAAAAESDAEAPVDGGGDAAAVAIAASDVTAAARSALIKPPAELTDFEFAALETIVLLTGRPAMRYRRGDVEMPPPGEEGENERWRTFVAIARSKINKVSSAVGRLIAVRDGAVVTHLGTGWRLGENLLVTNRHVAAQMVENADRAPSEWRFDSSKSLIADFAATDDAHSPSAVAIKDVLYCAEEETIDLAILQIDFDSGTVPPALNPDFSSDAIGSVLEVNGRSRFRGEEVYVVGHPLHVQTTVNIATVFGTADGLKRCSPGEVIAIPDREHAFEHDCSTLGGNSGSCVVSVSSHRIVGLHFGGVDVVDAASMGRANLALAFSRLGGHRAARILNEGRLV